MYKKIDISSICDKPEGILPSAERVPCPGEYYPLKILSLMTGSEVQFQYFLGISCRKTVISIYFGKEHFPIEM